MSSPYFLSLIPTADKYGHETGGWLTERALSQAMDVAAKLCEEAVEDADAHALSILMLQASHEAPESLERLVQVGLF